MGMTKLIAPGSQKLDDLSMKIVELSSRGLRGNDLSVLVKRAGHEFAELVKKSDLKDGDVPVHFIAIGSHEFFGPNRNGDTFTDEVCRNYHDTFVKHARFYRDHINKDPAKSYGFIKHSMWNEPMHRIELLVVLNGTKEAAARNGGLIADKELEKLAKSEDLPCSMSCTVPFDICMGCGNKAQNRSQYCTGTDEGGLCKRGGVKNKMGQVHDDGFINCVNNTIPDFFDLSKVWRNADRIAYSLGKAASACGCISGAELAEQAGIEAPLELLFDMSSPIVARQLKIASKLNKSASVSSSYEFAFTDGVRSQVNWNDHGTTSDDALAALAFYKIAMPIEGFIKFALGPNVDTSSLVNQINPRILDTTLRNMIYDSELSTKLASNPFVTYGKMPSAKARQWARKFAADYSLDRDAVNRRTTLASLRGLDTLVFNKVANASPAVSNLVEAYSLYKVGFLTTIEQTDKDFDFTCDMIFKNR